MSTAKMNAVGHRWVGELADFRFDVKYRPGKVNIDADSFSRFPLDIDTYLTKFTEELMREAIQATWEGCESAKRQDAAYVAALCLTCPARDTCEHVTIAVCHSDLVKSQRKDPSII